MALDHVRDYFMVGVEQDPMTNPDVDAALFFTRWVTHFCAPVFVLLAGTGAYLYGAQGRPRAAAGPSPIGVARYLLTRGLLLIALELTVVRFGWYFNTQPGFYLAQVIWAMGWSMLALAGLVALRTPVWLIGALGVALVAGHNLFDGPNPLPAALPTWLWTVLHRPGFIALGDKTQLYVLYPLLPWIGVMAAGYALGPLLQRPAAQQRRWLLGLGLALLAGFVVLRWTNVYGDPQPWRPAGAALPTLLAFLNVEKYPPSLLFLLATLGPALLALAWLDRPPGAVGRVLATYGRVPLFYYVLHLYLLHGLALLLAADGHRYGLLGVYAVWLAVVALLYWPCRWYAAFKQGRSEPWWKYI